MCFFKKHWLIILSCVVCLLDQISKEYMMNTLRVGESIEVIPQFFNLTLVMNPGAAFGLFANLPPTMRRVMLGLVTLFAMVLVVTLLKKDAKDDIVSKIALHMVLGGAFGNLIDRFRYDAVVDFLDVYWNDYHWPAFNVADSAISVAVCILLIKFTFAPHKPSAENAEKSGS